MSLSLVSVVMIDRLMKRPRKSALFGTIFFLIFLFPALTAFVGIYRNGAGDKSPAHKIKVAYKCVDSGTFAILKKRNSIK